MKRILTVVLAVTMAGGVAEARTDAPLAPTKATPADWAEVAEMLGEIQATLSAGEAALEGDKWRYQECRFQSIDGQIWSAREERLTTRCAVHKWLPGQLAKVFQVGSCESGWYRFARNGQYVGLFQHVETEFDDRVRAFEPGSWEMALSTSWANSRSQIVMSVRMVRAVGWGPWGCA